MGQQTQLWSGEQHQGPHCLRGMSQQLSRSLPLASSQPHHTLAQRSHLIIPVASPPLPRGSQSRPQGSVGDSWWMSPAQLLNLDLTCPEQPDASSTLFLCLDNSCNSAIVTAGPPRPARSPRAFLLGFFHGGFPSCNQQRTGLLVNVCVPPSTAKGQGPPLLPTAPQLQAQGLVRDTKHPMIPTVSCSALTLSCL